MAAEASQISRSIFALFPSRFTTHALAALLFSLLQHFLDEFTDRRLIHPFSAIDEHDAAIIAFRPAVAIRYFVLRNVDAHRIRSVVPLREDSLECHLSFAGKQPIQRDFSRPRMRRLVDEGYSA